MEPRAVRRFLPPLALMVVFGLGACAHKGPPTGGPPDVEPPRLIAASPDSGSQGVARDVAPSLTFSESNTRFLCEVEPGRIDISGKQARAEVSLKASIKAFTGKDHVLAPHQEVFVLEYKDGAWVRVK